MMSLQDLYVPRRRARSVDGCNIDSAVLFIYCNLQSIPLTGELKTASKKTKKPLDEKVKGRVFAPWLLSTVRAT